jgi:nicotinamide mononucleotide transporter
MRSALEIAASAGSVRLPIRRTAPGVLAGLVAGGVGVAFGRAWRLHRFTGACTPVLDSTVLAGGAPGQFLLLARRLDTWSAFCSLCLLAVNTISAPLLALRGLSRTVARQALFRVDAAVSLRQWQGRGVAT